MCGRVAETGNIVFVDRVDHNHDTSFDGMAPHGHYCIPIKFSKEFLGVLTLYVSEGHPYHSREETVLVAITDALAQMITHKRAEEDLLASKEAAEAGERTKSEFLSIMSHGDAHPNERCYGYVGSISYDSVRWRATGICGYYS